MLEIGSDVHGDVTVVSVRGEFDRCAMDALPGIFEKELAAAGPRVVVDLAETAFMDSGAIAMLLLARKSAVRSGGDLVLAAPPPLVTKCLDTLGLSEILASHADVATAVAFFG